MFLPENGVLHCGIEVDNGCVFYLEDELVVNGKLADFGRSRNINLLMTNMTFTRGFGTPTYSSPVVLNNARHEKATDVFSFWPMPFECFSPCRVYETPVQVSMANGDDCPAW